MKKKAIAKIISFLTILFLIIHIFIINYLINKTIIISSNYKEYKVECSDFIDYLKKRNLRILEKPVLIYDKILLFNYHNIKIERYLTNESLKNNNVIKIIPYYLSVNFDSKINRIDKKDINKAFNDFKKNHSLKYYFNKIDELNIKKRILLNKDNGKPVIFYEVLTYNIINKKNERLINLKKNIKYKYKQTENEFDIMGFAGDVVIDNDAKESISKHGVKYTFAEINHLLKIPDVMSVNLECTISDRGERENKSYTFRANEEQFKIISESPIDFVTNANNHANDYGHEALFDTIKYLKKYNIKYSGSGQNIYEAYKPEIINFENYEIAMFSICDVPDEYRGYKTVYNFQAKKDRPGIAVYNKELLIKIIKEEKNENRLVIVQFHTGDEYKFNPSRLHVDNSRSLIDIGADIVICHHPHVINGMEIYKNKLIFYSLGDFLFDLQKPNADEGIILYLYINKNRIISWSFHPTVSYHGRVIIDKNRVDDIERRFIYLSKKKY